MSTFDRKSLPSVRIPQPSWMNPEDVAIVVIRTTKKSYGCGHTEATSAEVNFLGVQTRVPQQDALCPKCWAEKMRKQIVLCCLCGEPIVPGGRILRYSRDNSQIIPETIRSVVYPYNKGQTIGQTIAERERGGAVTFDEEGCAIGCIRVGCADGLALFEGYIWTGECLQAE